MKNIIFILLSAFLILTLISCSRKDHSSSSNSSNDSSNSCPQNNYSSNVSNLTSYVSHITSDTGSRSSNLMDKVLYVDSKELSNYSADPYLSLDIFKGFQPDGVKLIPFANVNKVS